MNEASILYMEVCHIAFSEAYFWTDMDKLGSVKPGLL